MREWEYSATPRRRIHEFNDPFRLLGMQDTFIGLPWDHVVGVDWECCLSG